MALPYISHAAQRLPNPLAKLDNNTPIFLYLESYAQRLAPLAHSTRKGPTPRRPPVTMLFILAIEPLNQLLQVATTEDC